MNGCKPRTHQHHPPLFEHMPELSDEAVWDLLEMLYGLIDAYESHYEKPLQKLRLKRYRELHEHRDGERQLTLPIHDVAHDPF